MSSYQEVRVVRSARRRKTVSATVDKGVLIVRIPARIVTGGEQDGGELKATKEVVVTAITDASVKATGMDRQDAQQVAREAAFCE